MQDDCYSEQIYGELLSQKITYSMEQKGEECILSVSDITKDTMLSCTCLLEGDVLKVMHRVS